MVKRRVKRTGARTTTKRAGKKTAAQRTSRRTGRPRAGGITITSAGALHQARERVRDRLGSHFAAKASDDVLLLMGRAASVRKGAASLAAAARGRAVPAPLVVELKHQVTTPADVARVEALREAARLEDGETRERRIGAPQILRQTHMVSQRDEFYKAVAPLYAEIGRRSGGGTTRETLGSRRVLDVCWLNETIRTATAATALAEIAPDDAIERIDVPRRLVREMRLCGPLVGAPAFRTRTGKDAPGSSSR
jgi:hypothetical protein